MRWSLERGFAFIGVALIASFALFAAPSAEAAFGISPPWVHATHLVPGSPFEQAVYLVRDNAERDVRVRATLNLQSEKVRPWISLDPGFEFVIPAGVRQFPVKVIVNVPSDAELASYHNTIDFLSMPDANGQVTVALGVQASLEMTVGDDVFEKFTVNGIRVLDIEEGWNPRVHYRVVNEGNVPIKIEGATFDLFDQYGSGRLAQMQKREGFEEVPAFTTREFTVEFPTSFHTGLGQYWGAVTFYRLAAPVAGQKGPFNVLESGSIGGWFSILRYYARSYGAIAAGSIALALAVIVRRRRRLASKAA